MVPRSQKIEKRKWGEEINGTTQKNRWSFHVESTRDVHANLHE